MKLLRTVKYFLLASSLLTCHSWAANSLRGRDTLDDPFATTASAATVIQPIVAEYVASSERGGDGATHLANLQPSDCSACYNRCAWYDLTCYREKVFCNAYQALLSFLMRAIETACNHDPGRLEGRDLIEDAKMLLDGRGIFTLAELDSVKFRFCNLDGGAEIDFGMLGEEGAAFDLGRGTAITLSKDKVAFEYAYRDASTEDLAILMAHEMVHIRQYRHWGREEFCCRYLKEIENGNGFYLDNYIEKEAYDFEADVEDAIKGSLGE